MHIRRTSPDLAVPEIPTVYIDTETTSTRPAFLPDGKRVTEFAGIVVWPGETTPGMEFEFVIHDVDLTHADPAAMEVNGYLRRQPLGGWKDSTLAISEADAASYLSNLLAGVAIAAVNVAFDADGLGALLYRHGFDPEPWDYHLIELNTRAATVLGARPPWNSREMARQLGIDPDSFGTAHTALPDARLHHAIDQAVTARMRKAGWRAAVRALLGRR